jgi:DNA-binding response OmpR family regulator
MATLLIIDDENPIRALLKIQLSKNGHTILEAADGEEALSIVRTSRPDLIILDIIMPKKDGWQVCRELRDNPKTRSLPVVMLTGCHDHIAELRGWECGIDAYLTKPWDSEQLNQITARLLIQSKAAASVEPAKQIEESPKTILVVEDNPVIVSLLVRQLEHVGHKVITAGDAMLGAKMCVQHRPDLVLLDLMLPAGGGVAVLRQLRQSVYTNTTPVLVLTASDDVAARKQILEYGVHVFIKKPHDSQELLAFIRQATRSR